MDAPGSSPNSGARCPAAGHGVEQYDDVVLYAAHRELNTGRAYGGAAQHHTD